MRPNVLVIDDDPDTLTMVVKTLRLHLPDIILATAVHAQDALRLMEETKYDLIISDIIMPGMDGLELLRLARRLSPHTMVILLTGGPLTAKTEALASGAHAVVAKPFDVPNFVSVVVEALHRGNVLRQGKLFDD